MLEDGIPISLAPYGEPEMYYSPPIDRMRRVEILTGAAAATHEDPDVAVRIDVHAGIVVRIVHSLFVMHNGGF